MAAKKIFSFSYAVNQKNAAGVEEKIKKQGDAEALQFDSVADALAHFESIEAGKGETLLVEELNTSLKNTAIANMRASLTRKPILPKSLREKAGEKLDANEKATFNALMEKLGLQTLPV